MSPATRFKRMKETAKRLVRGGKTGSRLLGGIYSLPSGNEIFISYQNRKDVFRAGHNSISAAMDEGKACWGIDYDTMLEVKRKDNVTMIGVFVRDEGIIYAAPYDFFFCDKRANVINYEQRGNVMQKYLPIQHFVKVKSV